VQAVFDELATLTGRRYGLVDYHGAPDAERVVVIMGSGAGAVRETVDRLLDEGERVGLLTIRLFRPFPTDAFLAALPETVTSIAVLDRTKEPGSVGEPLFQDVVTTLADAGRTTIRTIGGRYGLGSKEFTPGMVKAVFDELVAERPRRRFTVGIVDDVTHLSLEVDPDFRAGRHTARRSSTRSAATARSVRTSRRSRSSVTNPVSRPRATSSTTRRSRGR
jgi:pyruvate-ferredoxin/flavodoxin oxidoreductase